MILAVAPIYNTDGNERVSKTNRPGQVGPEEGMGQRANARGLDLNRDFIKLEAPETRGLVRFLNEWNPHLFIDTHTTNGSYHRYTITYDGPKNPAGDPKIIGFMRKTFFPEVGAAFEKRTGLKAFYYGNFNRDHTQWTTYPAEARYGTTYVGLQKPALRALRGLFLRPVQDARAGDARLRARVPGNRGRATRRRSSSCSTRRGRRPRAAEPSPGQPGEPVAIRSQAQGRGRTRDGARLCRDARKTAAASKTDTTKDYTLQLMNEFEPAETVTRPFAYLVPPPSARRSRCSSGTAWRSRSCARTSSSTSRSTGSTRSRSRRGGSRGIKPSS